jgi:hypothetical protein
MDRHRFNPLMPPSEEYRLLERLCFDLRKLLDGKTRLSNQITFCLKEYYPQPVGVFLDVARPISLAFLDVARPISLAFLQAFPDPDTVQQTERPCFAAFFRAQCYTHP